MPLIKVSEEMSSLAGLNTWVDRSDVANPDINEEYYSDDNEEEDCSDDTEEEQMWRSLCQTDDPYHPLNFQVHLLSTTVTTFQSKQGPNGLHQIPKCEKQKTDENPKFTKSYKSRAAEPSLSNRLSKHCSHPEKILISWKRCEHKPQSSSDEKNDNNPNTTQKKVITFTTNTEIHGMCGVYNLGCNYQQSGSKKKYVKCKKESLCRRTGYMHIPLAFNFTLTLLLALTFFCNYAFQVRFSHIVQVHVMYNWSFARHAARKGHWEDFARDRDRFRKRIQETKRVIDHCFTQPHRDKILICFQAILDNSAIIDSINNK